MYSLRGMDLEAFPELYQEHIARDFPLDERPPQRVLHSLLTRGVCQGWMLEKKGHPVAYAIDVAGDVDVLVTFLAVFRHIRGGGIGGELLRRLKDMHRDRRSIIVEVEDPKDAKSHAEEALRKRRIVFYERGGFHLLEGIDYRLFGLPMRIMVCPLQGSLDEVQAQIRQVIQAIYQRMLPPMYYAEVQIETQDQTPHQ